MNDIKEYLNPTTIAAVGIIVVLLSARFHKHRASVFSKDFIANIFNPDYTAVELHDAVAVMFVVAFILQSIYVVALDPRLFNAQQFGIGSASIIGAISAAGWLKSRTRRDDGNINTDKVNVSVDVSNGGSGESAH